MQVKVEVECGEVFHTQFPTGVIIWMEMSVCVCVRVCGSLVV